MNASRGDLQSLKDHENQSTSEMAPIDSLPTEILVLIFSWLSVDDLGLSVSRVCQRWNEAMHFKQLWYDKELVYINGQEDLFVYVLSVAPALRKLSINPLYCEDSDAVVKAIRKGPKNINNIHFNLSLFPFGTAACILSHYKDHVLKLHLVGHENKPSCIYRHLGTVIGQMSQLGSLELSGYFDTKWDEKALEQGCKKLYHLDVSFIHDESDSYLPLLNNVKSQLKTLKLPQYKSDVEVLRLVSSCTELEEITLCLDDLRCISTLRSLRALHIKWSDGVLKSNMSQFVRECPVFENITELHLQYIPAPLASSIAKRCLNLKALSMHGILSCSEIIKLVPSVEKLCIVDLVSLRMRHVQKLPCFLPNLKYLDLQGCFENKGIPPKIVSHLKNTLPGLQILCKSFVKYSKSAHKVFLSKCKDSSTDCSSDEAC